MIFVFGSPEPGVSFECALDPIGTPVFSDCASPPENMYEVGGLLPGPHRLLIRAIDPSLNFDRSPIDFRWTVVGPALTTITADVPAVPATTTAIEATFTFSANQPGVTYMCSLDGAEFTPCTSPMSYEDLPIGEHTFEVQSTNRFLHVEEPPAVYEWAIELPVDVELPDTTDHAGSARSEHAARRRPSGSRPTSRARRSCASWTWASPWASGAVHLAEDVQRPARRRAHLPGARGRPARHSRSGPGDPRVDRRPAARDVDRRGAADADA